MKLKKFSDILKGMALWVSNTNSKLTNMRPGSVIRTLLEAVSSEIESLYFEARRGFTVAIEESIFNSFNFRRKPAIASRDYIDITFRSPLADRFILREGVRFFTVPIEGEVIYFRSVEEAMADRGESSMRVLVECEEAGDIGNVPPYSIRRMESIPSYIQDVYNEAGFLNGIPAESKRKRRSRFTGFIDSLARGTVPSLRYACLLVDGVIGAEVEEGIGTIRIYAHNRQGTLSDFQTEEIKSLLPEYKCAGIKAEIVKTSPEEIDLDITVTLDESFDIDHYRAIIRASLISYLNTFTVGKPVLRADLIRFIMGIDDNAILNVELDMEKDLYVLSHQLVRAGDILVEVLR